MRGLRKFRVNLYRRTPLVPWLAVVECCGGLPWIDMDVAVGEEIAMACAMGRVQGSTLFDFFRGMPRY